MIIEKLFKMNDGSTYVHLSGFSEETKPTEYAEGSEFYETDTGKNFYFTGEEWKEVGGSGSGEAATPREVRVFTASETTQKISLENVPKCPKVVMIIEYKEDSTRGGYLHSSLFDTVLNLNYVGYCQATNYDFYRTTITHSYEYDESTKVLSINEWVQFKQNSTYHIYICY